MTPETSRRMSSTPQKQPPASTATSVVRPAVAPVGLVSFVRVLIAAVLVMSSRKDGACAAACESSNGVVRRRGNGCARRAAAVHHAEIIHEEFTMEQTD